MARVNLPAGRRSKFVYLRIFEWAGVQRQTLQISSPPFLQQSNGRQKNKLFSRFCVAFGHAFVAQSVTSTWHERAGVATASCGSWKSGCIASCAGVPCWL